MRTIYKYQFEINDTVYIDMFDGANVLTVMVQNGIPTIWAEVDESGLKQKTRKFAVIGTGNPMPSNPLRYIGSFQERVFVWHLYEMI